MLYKSPGHRSLSFALVHQSETFFLFKLLFLTNCWFIHKSDLFSKHIILRRKISIGHIFWWNHLDLWPIYIFHQIESIFELKFYSPCSGSWIWRTFIINLKLKIIFDPYLTTKYLINLKVIAIWIKAIITDLKRWLYAERVPFIVV